MLLHNIMYVSCSFPSKRSLRTCLTIVISLPLINQMWLFLSGTYLEISLLLLPCGVRGPTFWYNGHARCFSHTPFCQCEIFRQCHHTPLSHLKLVFLIVLNILIMKHQITVLNHVVEIILLTYTEKRVWISTLDVGILWVSDHLLPDSPFSELSAARRVVSCQLRPQRQRAASPFLGNLHSMTHQGVDGSSSSLGLTQYDSEGPFYIQMSL